MLFALAATLCSATPATVEGDVAAAGGDYVDVAFEVPAGIQEIRISHDDGSPTDILDWGVWSPDGFRGWGGGLTEDAVIGVGESSRGYLPGPITPGTWTVVVGKALLDADGGHYAITVTCADTPTLPPVPRAAFTPVVVDPARRWYKGDFHVHSRESGDASASFDDITGLARQRGLDFVNLSDHNTVSQHALQAAYLASHPDFLLLRGAEITTYQGHGNAVGLDAYVDHRIGYAGRTITGVLDDVAAQGAIFIVNHPKLDLGSACIGCAWRHDDTDWNKVSGLELITGNYSLGVSVFVPQVIAMWDGLLDQGYRIAAIGGSDDHTAGMNESPTGSPIGSPTTLVLADHLSEPAIVEAVRRGRTMVQLRGPDDPLLEVTMKTATGGTAEIGDDVEGVDHVRLALHVTGGAGTFAQLWRDGAMVGPEAPVDADDFTAELDDVPGAGDFRYRVELVSDGNQRLVVTSHFYVHAIAGSDGCGCSGGGGLGGGAVPLLAMLGGLAWRRPRRARRATPHRAPPA
ncbi:MAG TPA: CehA/McbA family metallohydrolase [Kofleriaceae bacterium]|nr:CehA/McbA family metallohydrolase [Kofleriaceae bacterium]